MASDKAQSLINELPKPPFETASARWERELAGLSEADFEQVKSAAISAGDRGRAYDQSPQGQANAREAARRDAYDRDPERAEFNQLVGEMSDAEMILNGEADGFDVGLELSLSDAVEAGQWREQARIEAEQAEAEARAAAEADAQRDDLITQNRNRPSLLGGNQ